MLKAAPRAPSHVPNVISFGNDTHEDYYECLVTGSLEKSTFSRLLTFLESTGFVIERSSFEADIRSDSFSSLLLIRSQKSDLDMFELVEKIMQSNLVRSIEFSPRHNRIFSHFRFPLELTRGQSGVVISPSSFLTLERAYQKTAKAPGPLFFEGGRSYGAELVSLCPKKSLFVSETEYMEAVLDVTQAAGWGVCKSQELEGNQMLLLLSEAPLGAESTFIVGMLVGIAEAVLNRKMHVLTTHFDKSKNIVSVKIASD